MPKFRKFILGMKIDTLLKIDKLSAWYGDTRVLNEVDIEIKEGEIVALLGEMEWEKLLLYIQYVG